MFNKRKAVFFVLFSFITCLIYADPASDIAKAGDDAWNNLIAQYKKESRWVDPVSANVVVNNFNRYEGKVMLFPAIDCMRRVHTPPLWGVSKNVPLTKYVGMYPETNRTFRTKVRVRPYQKQPYPVRSAAGLVDFGDFITDRDGNRYYWYKNAGQWKVSSF